MMRRATKDLPKISAENEETIIGEISENDTAYIKSLLYEAFKPIL